MWFAYKAPPLLPCMLKTSKSLGRKLLSVFVSVLNALPSNTAVDSAPIEGEHQECVIFSTKIQVDFMGYQNEIMR